MLSQHSEGMEIDSDDSEFTSLSDQPIQVRSITVILLPIIDENSSLSK
jgi:hypothetical protein